MKFVSAAVAAATVLLLSTAAAEQASPSPSASPAQAAPGALAAAMPKPNLRFVGGIRLRLVPGGPEVQRVRRGHRFLACYRVGNGGPVASGAFQVRGSPFGNPVGPFQNHPGLASGATHDRCLLYPAVVLPPGNHLLQIKADATNVVAESSEADNVVQRVVLVTP
jgi:hypothetical protein